ncbi:MAG: hypothetical protein NZ772_17615 [Cyanobacteria bacterium]|nr:hypothetical protein [Cyanobacteriota bacterium]MDW8202937.1 hypothetical protein [Cyanobacteriota bacterium SKYGB_h_bin112]
MTGLVTIPASSQAPDEQAVEREQQRAEQERLAKESAQHRAEQLVTYLQSLGIDPDNVAVG